MVKLYPLEDADEIEAVRDLIRKHAEYTKSERAWIAPWTGPLRILAQKRI